MPRASNGAAIWIAVLAFLLAAESVLLIRAYRRPAPEAGECPTAGPAGGAEARPELAAAGQGPRWDEPSTGTRALGEESLRADPEGGAEAPEDEVLAQGSRTDTWETREQEATRRGAPEERPEVGPETFQELIDQGLYDQALSLLGRYVQDNPDDIQGQRMMGRLFETLGLVEEAIDVYERWATLAPDDPQPEFLLARSYAELGFDDEALAALDRFERLADEAPRNHAVTAGLYRRLGRPEQELASLESWLREAPQSARAHRALGDFHLRAGDYERALDEYRFVREALPDNPSARVQLARSYQQLGRHAEAQAELEVAVGLRPQDLRMRLSLGDAYRVGGDVERALQAYERVVADAPGSAEGLRAQRSIDSILRQLSAQVR